MTAREHPARMTGGFYNVPTLENETQSAQREREAKLIFHSMEDNSWREEIYRTTACTFDHRTGTGMF